MNKYCKNNDFNKIDRIFNNNEKYDGLRLTRAERVEPFDKTFFDNFIKSITQDDIRYYPDTFKVKRKIVEYIGVKNDNIFLNFGSSESIRTIFDCFCEKGKNVIVSNPCFPMHWIYPTFRGCNVIKIDYDQNYILKYTDLLKQIDKNTCCVCISNPNSPIGDVLTYEQIVELIKKCYDNGSIVVIDEAYIEYSDCKSCVNLISEYDNLIVSRTFSKAFGCAGLRIGFLLSNASNIKILNKLVPCYESTALSCKFIIHLLNNIDIVNSYTKKIKEERLKFKKWCIENDIPHVIGQINSCHIRPNNLDKIIDELNDNKIYIKKRKIPNSNENWIIMVLFPGLCESNVADIIKKNHLL